MTRELAILHMVLRRQELKSSVGELDEDIKAFDVAINSIEAWDDIRSELSEQINSMNELHDYGKMYGL